MSEPIEEFEKENFIIEQFEQMDFEKITFEKYQNFSLKDFATPYRKDGERIKQAIKEKGLTFADMVDMGFIPFDLMLVTKGYIKADKEECKLIAEALGDIKLANFLFTGIKEV